MSIIAFGDIHLINKNLVRETECLNFLNYIEEYASKNGIKNIMCLGDVFDRGNNLRTESFLSIFNKFYEMKGRGLNLYFINGNHDQISLNDEHNSIVEAFKSLGTYIQKSATVNIDGYDYDCLSYTETVSDLPNKSRVLFTHLGVKGFMFSGSMMDDKSNFEQQSFDQYSLVVSGHLHVKQEKGNLLFVGSPYQTRADEKGKTSYFAVIDQDQYKLVEYNEAPEYMTVSSDDIEKYGFEKFDFKNKILTVRLTKKVENFVKLRDLMYKHGAVEVFPEFVKEETSDQAEHTVDIGEGVVKSAVRYLGETKADGIDNAKLLGCFKEILKRAGK